MATFIDANVPIYSAGALHPLKHPCTLILEMVGASYREFVTDAEVLQEILHVYLARRDWLLGRVAFSTFVEIIDDRIAAILSQDVIGAAQLADSYPTLDARDLIHLAVMRRLGVTRIISADTGFDRVPEVERLDPRRFEAWRETV